jgi:hypothetical protein
MSTRRVVIASTSFAAADLDALVGRHPSVIAPGVIRQGTRLYDDDPIVVGHPNLFVDARIVPGAPEGEMGGARRPPLDGLTRERIVDAVIEGREPEGTWPTQSAVADALGYADSRRLRQVQGPRGWAGILNDAEARLIGK